MRLPAIEIYEFGPFRIDSGERLLRRDSELIPLPPKVAGTLLVLIENAGRMVDKADLMKAVWSDTFVEEGALTRNISLLRKALGDTGDEAAYIETIPRRGYRFIAPVRTVSVAEAAVGIQTEPVERPALVIPKKLPAKFTARRVIVAAILLLAALGAMAKFMTREGDSATPTATPAIVPANTIAVLPFRGIENDPSEDYLAEGMTESLITRLASLRDLRVVSLAADGGNKTSGARKDDAAWTAALRNQSVKRVLTGTIVRSGGRVRINAQLKDPATREVYWANSYERDFGDALALESDVAEAIATEVQGSITARDRERLRQSHSAPPEAMDAYLKGRYFWNRRTEDGLKRAVEYFQQAIAADPANALAYSGLADSYSLLGSVELDGMPPNKAMPLAKAAAQKALELDPGLAEGHNSLAYVKLSYDWDLPGAQREFTRALELNPGSATAKHWFSHYYMATGNLVKASELMRDAFQLEPLSPSINIGVGWCLYYSRQYDQAIEQFRSVTESDPSLPLAHQTLGMAYQQKGLTDQAIEEYQRAAALSNNSPASVAALASIYAETGKPAESAKELALLDEMSHTRYVPALYFASVHYAMGDMTKTFQFGWKAIGERCDYLIYLRVEPRAGNLAANPEFIKAMAALHP